MTKATPFTDKDLLNTVLRGVKRHTHTKVTSTPTRPPARRRYPHPHEDDFPLHYTFSDYEKYTPVNSDDALDFARSELDQKTLRKFRQGQYTIETKLDLHGMTADQARDALSRFLSHCRARKYRHVLIVHGKGHRGKPPILKNRLNHWLREASCVLAFTSAQARHGGNGALYILIR